MKRSLIYLVAFMFLMTAAVSFAGDAAKTSNSGCPMMQGKQVADTLKTATSHAGCPYMGKTDAQGKDASATATDEKKPMGSCPMMGKASDKAEAPTTEVKEAAAMATKVSAGSEPKIGETCPDVSGKTALSNFHDVMSPMHMAFEKNKYDEMKSSMPKLIEVSKGIATYKCPMNGKCSPDCMKKFDEKKAALLKGVDELDLAFKGNDNKKVDTAFMTMHQSFVDFAGMCGPNGKETTAKAVEAKSETK